MKGTEGTVKLHIGCGTDYKDGWINIDNNSDNNIRKLDMNVDLRNGLPFKDNSVDYIFNEHFLEHLTWDEGTQTIREFMRVLKPGGILRIAMPDLARSVKMYEDENWEYSNLRYFKKYGIIVETRAQNLNLDFRAWGHKHLYDFEEFERQLKAAGCENIKRRFFCESTHEELRNLETRKESTLIAEVVKGKSFIPLLTVVCITYNQVAFIRDALESFVTQETNFPFEVLISDDASTDNTPEVIREYEKKYPKIIKAIYRKTNIGVENNFLYTLSEVLSKYVIYNEGDDYFSDTCKLQRQVDFLESRPECSICFHPVTIRFQDGSKPDEFFPSVELRFNKTEMYLEDILKHNFMQTNSVMYRWRFNEENILDTFPSSIMPMDYYLHLLHAQKGVIGFIDEVMAVYRRHPGGIWWDSQSPEKLHSRYCTEMFTFFYEIGKRIAGDSETYFSNSLVPVFKTIIDSTKKCGETKKLIGLFERYPQFVIEQYLQLQALTLQKEQHIQSLELQKDSYFQALEQHKNELEQHKNELNTILNSRTYRTMLLLRRIAQKIGVLALLRALLAVRRKLIRNKS